LKGTRDGGPNTKKDVLAYSGGEEQNRSGRVEQISHEWKDRGRRGYVQPPKKEGPCETPKTTTTQGGHTRAPARRGSKSELVLTSENPTRKVTLSNHGGNIGKP